MFAAFLVEAFLRGVQSADSCDRVELQTVRGNSRPEIRFIGEFDSFPICHRSSSELSQSLCYFLSQSAVFLQLPHC